MVSYSKEEIQSASENSIEERNTTLNDLAPMKFFILNWLIYGSFHCGREKSISWSLCSLSYGSESKSKIQSETETQIWFFRVRLNFTVLLRLPIENVCSKKEQSSIFVHCKHYHTVIYMKQSIPSPTTNSIPTKNSIGDRRTDLSLLSPIEILV